MSAIPQPQPVPAPKQVTFPNVVISVQPMPEGNVMLIIAAPGETLIFPMSAEYAQNLGKTLCAPRVIPVTNGHGPSEAAIRGDVKR